MPMTMKKTASHINDEKTQPLDNHVSNTAWGIYCSNYDVPKNILGLDYSTKVREIFTVFHSSPPRPIEGNLRGLSHLAQN